MDNTPVIATAAKPQEHPVFAPALFTASVVRVTRGGETATEPDKDMFFFGP
ncbi:hypothetical protein OG285_05980 [Streptomyces sp. NBC_01471]|uniref:hypothetical protein n=1 Tax=Streptomyces sp. NBC_01471 TaxID=2903879 RepID=UPI0032487F7B